MTALEFMEKQLRKCQYNFHKEFDRGAPVEVVTNLRQKCGYYEAAVAALRKVEVED